MAVTTVAKPGDFMATFSLQNITSSTDMIRYGVLATGKIYRERRNHDGPGLTGGPGTYVDTGLTIADVASQTDL